MEHTPALSSRVAEEIRALLARRRVSGRKLAEALGFSQSAMSARLTGATPIDLNDLERIAGFLNVEVTELLPRASEGRVLKTAGRPMEEQAAPIKFSQSTPAKRPQLTGQGPGARVSPSLVRTARKRPAATNAAPTRPMHGRRASAAG